MKKSIRTPSPAAVLFKAKRKTLKLSQTALADKVRELLGPEETFTQQTYAAFEAGVAQNTRYALQIAQVLGISLKELASPISSSKFSEQRERSEAVLLGAIEVWDDETPLDNDEVEVPLLKEVELSAGNGSLAIQQHSTSKLRFGKITLRRQGIEPAAVICVSVSGASMEPVLPNGSTVGVDQSKKAIKDGDIYALSHNDHLRVKMLYRLPSGGIRMRSFNREEYPDEEYTVERIELEDIKILGRVFWYSVLR
ncbi:helix-turn-helix transcriptional regulator [Pseudomonas viridiflava]|uniref:S24 family peptidase n=1 Tax=Pseudomonas viridiflava TaxID=33069 RepID=UPI00211D502C|nr:helix-turn-helix transcriptional regulator [Pseudomonas viridiflava]MCQ9393299.1 helix-turn-helix transcriptional regulator [Pseudomonas viridiflava]